MRESNFAFPAQNRACVCITSQLYDRRALDTNAPLPLFNSLTHLTYLTSTSPRIREIMTMDGGLERLVRIIHDFCICPPPPENPALFYGLQSPSSHPPKPVPTLIPKSFDRSAQQRFSLALQCVVNIGVRGSEPIRSRVVQAGTLDVVGCILEAWLAGRGFAVGPNVSANGMPRETRERRMARRQAQAEMRSRDHTAELDRALQRQIALDRAIRLERAATGEDVGQDDSMDIDQTSTEDTDTPTDTSTAVTPGGIRGRSGTIIARSTTLHATSSTHRRSRPFMPSASTSADNSRPETETEDDGDVDMDRESSREIDPPSVSVSPSPERRDSSADTGTVRAVPVRSRRLVGIVSDTPSATATVASPDLNTDAHIIINEQGGLGEGVSVEDGVVSLEQNDDLAMGAPPGAPGAIDNPAGRAVTDMHGSAGERTPRARPATLPMMIPIATPTTTPTLRVTGPGEPARTVAPGTGRAHANRGTNTPPTGAAAGPTGAAGQHTHHHPREEFGPYRDEDVLLSLQLLAYLSKYPYVRQAFYKPRPTFHPASLNYPTGDGRVSQAVPGPSGTRSSMTNPSSSSSVSGSSSSVQTPVKEPNSFLRAFASATGRGKEKEKAPASPGASGSTSPVPPQHMTNVFSLVERFTFRHSSSELDSPNTPPSLPPEIQYWAGVIMRNACRKDDSRGGIRQCANMLCGKWETFPREFAKCRRCRKAKYCGKECQSTAWSEGHRFWCSAKDPEEDGDHHHGHGEGSSRSAVTTTAGGTVTGRAERRAERERERHARAVAAEARLAEHLGVRAPGGTVQNPMRTAVSAIGIDPNATLAALNAPPPTPRAPILPPPAGAWAPQPLTARPLRGEEMPPLLSRTGLGLNPPTERGDGEPSREALRHLMHLVEGQHETDRGEGPTVTPFIGQRMEEGAGDDLMIFD
ncbi:hypothetical protein SCP_1104280 [Sparassis crispa]|uniref:MYND-type domain-containing protein n=1 Tax=Sparassis crispa TaxID=139825 RepID=A0A401H011_9APHY|nr:hypothetical protein SCP_1104280 [Sparassis crispa]GBE87751.1 hypothetical protein SCP_1104280 [Sparassis crispa]